MKKLLSSWGPWLLSALLLGMAFPPLNWWPLIFFALIPWLRQLREGDLKGGFWGGYGFGFVYFGFQMFWIVPFVEQWTGKLGLAVVPWLVCAFLAGWFYALVGWLMARCYQRGWVWLVPLVWAGIEGFRAYIPGLAFPWGNVSLPLWQEPALAQLGAYGTMFLVSAWVVLVSVSITEVMAGGSKEWPLWKRGMAALWILLVIPSLVRYGSMPPGEKKVFTLGQPGVDMAFTQPDEERAQLTDATRDLLAAAIEQKTNLLILPEGYAGSVVGEVPLTPLGYEPAVPVIMGAHRVAGEAKSYQTAYAWDGSTWSFADKTRLVVFGEYVPLRDQLPFLKNFNLPAGDLMAAEEFKTIQVGDMKVGQLICFEGVFPDLAVGHSNNGAQVLVQMSIDDWYEATLAHDQLWMSTIWRSIESGLPVMRVGGRGKSLATDARGNLIAEVPVGARAARKVEVVVPERSDAFGGRFWFVYLTWAVCVFVWADRMRERFKK